MIKGLAREVLTITDSNMVNINIVESKIIILFFIQIISLFD